MGGKASRDKGLNYEREIARKLKHIFPDVKRHLEFQYQECDGYDLDNTGKFKIQCKRLKKYTSISKIEEVQAKPGEIPALITKGDRKKDVVCLYLQDFINLLDRFNKAKEYCELMREKNTALIIGGTSN